MPAGKDLRCQRRGTQCYTLRSWSCSRANTTEPSATPKDPESSICIYDLSHSPSGGGKLWKILGIIYNFSPSWFSVTMGTGIVAILLEKLPYQFHGLHVIAICLFILNIFLFVVFLALTIARYVIWPRAFPKMLHHPVESLFTGTFPMGFATLINLTALICVPAWGGKWAMATWIMWWIDVFLSLCTCFYVPFLVMSKHETELENMHAIWLLPIITPIVAAATGSVIAEVLPDNHALVTIIVSYLLWGTGVPLSMFILVIYLHRLLIHKLPPREVVVSVLLPLGPFGQGAFGIMQLGKDARKVFPKVNFLSPLAGEVFYAGGAMLALIMWGFALVWIFLAIATLSRCRFQFSMGWWALIFPLGVFTLATTMFGSLFQSVVFNILGTILTCIVVILWLIVMAMTIWKSIAGELLR